MLSQFYDTYDGMFRWRSDRADSILPDREQLEALWQWNQYIGYEPTEFGGTGPILGS